MALVTTRGRTTDLQMSKKWKERETSPERNKVWIEPPNKVKAETKVPVVYYLSRNGHLDHPHFIEVPLSSSQGLFLRDVINRLNSLRGQGMATMYSWSCKRSYKNGFVWHDLSENDFIYPAHGQEYVLKGSELLEGNLISKSDETVSSGSKNSFLESRKSEEISDSPLVRHRRNQSLSAIDVHEYKVYKADSTGEYAGRAAADASTQTDDRRRRRRAIRDEAPEKDKKSEETCQNQSTELSRDEITPPPSDSSPESLETLMKSEGRLTLCASGEVDDDRTVSSHPSGRMKASSVLMQLLSCGSVSFRDCGPGYGKDQGFSLISYYKTRVPRGAGSNRVGKEAEEALGEKENPRKVMVEDKEYFSGSLIETKKDEFPALKRSSSYNAERCSKLDLIEEIDGVKARCIPRKPKTRSKKEGNNDISCNAADSQQVAKE
ncbi:protein SOSEKI 5 [Cornus florida]|uniref:protein SOSEKI 5 n=1 Tax=Cornus florida TaxID=4283 RepID=UPI0028A1A9AD|nr:protein SOSEKI 5 [Cornus florida]